MGRGLGWVTHRGPCQPLPCWDSVVLGKRMPPHAQLAPTAIPPCLENTLLSCIRSIQLCAENFLIHPSFLALSFVLRCQRRPLSGRTTPAPCWGHLHHAPGCKQRLPALGTAAARKAVTWGEGWLCRPGRCHSQEQRQATATMGTSGLASSHSSQCPSWTREENTEEWRSCLRGDKPRLSPEGSWRGAGLTRRWLRDRLGRR